MGLFCGLVHSAFCMLFCVRSWQGAEEYTGTQGPGPSEKPGFWKHYFPALPGQFCIIPWTIFPSG